MTIPVIVKHVRFICVGLVVAMGLGARIVPAQSSVDARIAAEPRTAFVTLASVDSARRTDDGSAAITDLARARSVLTDFVTTLTERSQPIIEAQYGLRTAKSDTDGLQLFLRLRREGQNPRILSIADANVTRNGRTLEIHSAIVFGWRSNVGKLRSHSMEFTIRCVAFDAACSVYELTTP